MLRKRRKIPDFTRYVSLIQDFLCCQIVSRETPFFVVTLEAVAENLLVKFMSSSCPHPSVDLSYSTKYTYSL